MELLRLDVNSELSIGGKIEPIRFRDIVDRGASESDLESLIEKYPSLLNMGTYDSAPELLIISRQPVTASRKRADLFAIDQDGALVVVEVKRDLEDERSRAEGIEFQAIRYAASSRRMTADDIVETFAAYLRRKEGSKTDSLDLYRSQAVRRIAAHLEDEEQSLTEEDLADYISPSENQRILLVAADFDAEVTAACAWLREHEINISCFRLQPFKISGTVCLNRERLIPPAELDEFYLDMASPVTPSRRSDQPIRRRSDKPTRLTWSDPEIGDMAVNSWKGALIASIKCLLDKGLAFDDLPMKHSRIKDDPAMNNGGMVSDSICIETHASSENIMGWISAAMRKTTINGNPITQGAYLKIETRSGESYELPSGS